MKRFLFVQASSRGYLISLHTGALSRARFLSDIARNKPVVLSVCTQIVPTMTTKRTIRETETSVEAYQRS